MTAKAYQYDLILRTPFNIQKWEVGGKEDATIRRSLTVQAKASIAVAIVIFIVVLTVVLVCFIFPFWEKTEYWLPEYESISRLGKFEHAAVSTDAAPCAVIGKDILLRNGSAVDAAIAVLLCMGVVNPQSLGLGGGFFMLYYNRTSKDPYFIDSREVAPEKATEDMFQSNHTSAMFGGLAIAVPSELAGYHDIHNRFGRLPWQELFPPTIRMCREGITVNAHLARALTRYKEEIHRFEHLRNIFTNNSTGELYKENEVYTRLKLADTLEIIAKEKSRALYGPSNTSTNFLQDLEEAGSIITESDLRHYTPRLLEPVTVGIQGNLTLHTAPPPGSGPLLAFMLSVLGQDLDPDAARTQEGATKLLHRVVETFKFAYAKRMYMEDSDSEDMKQIVSKLMSKEFADEVRSLIDDEKTFDSPEHYGVNVTIQEDHGTAHVCIVAPNGDVVSATSTVNQYFGSMVVSPSTGIILNNEMDDFSSPNITNYFGVPPTGKNHIQPGRRPLSSMTPAIIVDAKGDVRLAIGGNGGTQITTSVAQTIIRNLYLKEDIKKAIDAPRFHHQLLPNYIEHEVNFPRGLLNKLKEKGHDLHSLGSKMLGIIMGISKEEDGYLYANADYRKMGEVDGF